MVFVSELGFARMRSVHPSADSASSAASKNVPKLEESEPSTVRQNTNQKKTTKGTSGSVPVQGATHADETKNVPFAVNQTAAPVGQTVSDSSNQVSMVQMETTWREAADRLVSVRGMVMVAVDHDQRVADLILDSLLLYGQARRVIEQLGELSQKSERQLAQVSGAYVLQTIQRAETALQSLEKYINAVVTDQVALRKLINKLRHTTIETRRAMASIVRARELAERRAYLRAAVRKVQLRLQQLPELSVQERSVREQLQPFTALDSFPNLPETQSEQQALAKTLEELEPLYARLEDSISTILERPLPVEDTTTDTELESESDWWEEVASELESEIPVTNVEKKIRVEESAVIATEDTEPLYSVEDSSLIEDESTAADVAAEVINQSSSDEETSEVMLETSEVTEPETLTASADDFYTGTEGPTALSQGLGWYQLQRGDTLMDILLGETDAGILPAMVEIPPSYIGTLSELVRAYLDQYRTVRQYLGTREAIDVWAMRGSGHPEISLDYLNDILMYVASRNDLLSIAPAAWEHLSNTMGQLEKQSDALEATLAEHALDFTPHSVRQRAQGKGRGVRWATFNRVPTEKNYSETTLNTQSLLPKSARRARAEVVQHVYHDHEAAYETDLMNWIETLFLAPRDRARLVGSMLGRSAEAMDPREEFLALHFSDWHNLLHDTTLRYDWLQRHMVPASVWRDWSRQVLTWQRTVQTYERNDIAKLPLLAVAELVFINRSSHTLAR